MDKILRNYRLAQKDINLGNLPHRRLDKDYHWNFGQRHILDQAEYSDLRNLNVEVASLLTQKERLIEEIMQFEVVANRLETQAEQIIRECEDEIELQKNFNDSSKDLLKREEEDLANRGYYMVESATTSNPVTLDEEKKESATFGLKKIAQLIGLWALCEVFMTYVQWSELRDYNGVETLFARSASFGVILLLVHWVAHLYQKQRRVIYGVFMAFSIAMLLIMLVAPLAINKLYSTDSTQTVSSQWSLSSGSAEPAPIAKSIPFLLDFYRDNQVLPAILCLLFFITMISFLRKKSDPIAPKIAEPEINPTPSPDNTKGKRNFLHAKIEQGEAELLVLTQKKHKRLEANTAGLHGILTPLETKYAECLEIEKRVATHKTKAEVLLSQLETELVEYSVEFQDILKNGGIKNTYVVPEWNSREDILKYYKIQSL